jgi:Flp pilus assembly protein TadD
VLGEIDLEKTNFADAVKAFEQESKADSTTSKAYDEARALLAKSLIESGRRSDGEAIARELGHTHPELARALRNEGELLLKNGDVHTACAELGAATVLLPADLNLRREFETAKGQLRAPSH